MKSTRAFAILLTLVSTLGALYFVYKTKSVDATDLTKEATPKTATEVGGATPSGEKRSFSMTPSVNQDSLLPREEKRVILALYDGLEQTIDINAEDEDAPLINIDAESAYSHRFAELPLNHLGLKLKYQDVNKPWPSDAEMAEVRGMVVWFLDDYLNDPRRYVNWLVKWIRAGKKVVFMERLGGMKDINGKLLPNNPMKPLLDAMNVQYTGGATFDATLIQVKRSDKNMMGFERKIVGNLPYYDGFKAPESASVFLKLGRNDIKKESDVVFVAPFGGFVLRGYAFTEDRLGERWVRRWDINPFKFFAKAFGVTDVPKADFTTLNGSRVFYAHIDGDGGEMLSEINNRLTCAEVVQNEILTKFNYPWTISFVVGRTAPPPIGFGTKTDVRVARDILKMNNVEAASHGLAHPMDWRGGADAELSVDDLPDYVLSGETEIRQSVEYIDRYLVPPGKKTKVMLWTGWTNPSEEQLQIAYEMGLHNLNGGDGRMDSHYPSYAHMAPAIHQVGEFFQYYSSMANDYVLTDGWQPPYYRFQNIVETFEKTNERYRIMPLNIYVHFYISRNQAALTGLTRVMEWVEKHEIAPVFVSEHVDRVKDAYWSRVARKGDGWQGMVGEHLRTLRMDSPDVHVDLRRSKGVIGYFQDKKLGVTYIHLDSNAYELYFAGKPPQVPHLSKATHAVKNLKHEGGKLTFETSGVGEGTFIFYAGQSKNNTQNVVVNSENKELTASVVSLPKGYIKVKTTLAGLPSTVEVTL